MLLSPRPILLVRETDLLMSFSLAFLSKHTRSLIDEACVHLVGKDIPIKKIYIDLVSNHVLRMLTTQDLSL